MTFSDSNILQQLNVAVVALDENLTCTFINAATENLLRLSKNHVIGKPVDHLLPFDAPFYQRLSNALKNLQPFSAREIHLVMGTGFEITIDCVITPLTAVNSPNLLLLEINQVDRHVRITQKKNLLAQQENLEIILKELTHEIKNPLGGLRGAAQLLERELKNKELREYTAVIISEADRLNQLINRILTPNSILTKNATNIHKITERVLGLIEAESSDRLSINRDYDPSIPDIMLDRDPLIQALLNIGRNAMQAIDGQGKITCKTRTERNYTIGNAQHRLVLKVSIEDNGCGIPEDIKQKIFFPLVSGKTNGSGLGLSIAQTIINQHNGLIECDSMPGKTLFTIVLPFLSAT